MTMNIRQISFSIAIIFFFSSCVSKKRLTNLQAKHKTEMDLANAQLGKCGESLNNYMNQITNCENEKAVLKNTINGMYIIAYLIFSSSYH